MIELFTGNTGSGKTALVVSKMSEVKNRPFFVMGIPELKLDHQPVPPVSEWVEQRPMPEDPSIRAPFFTFPPNSIVVIDEAQNIYRPRPSGSRVPDIVAAFETHRHTGVDFWLITQHPSLLDQNIRRLVKIHRHIHETFLGNQLLEWRQCRDPDSKIDRGEAISTKYKPPKKVFSLYKSAEAHTSIKGKFPKTLIVIAVCVLIFAALVYRLSGRVSSVLNGEQPKPQASAVVPASAAGPGAVREFAPGEVSNPVERYIPLHPDYPETAPIYRESGIVQVKDFPRVTGCFTVRESCRCVDQQGVSLQVTDHFCRSYVVDGRFDPYRDPAAHAVPSVDGAGQGDVPSAPESPPASSSPQSSA